jgi:hypothetical protein
MAWREIGSSSRPGGLCGKGNSDRACFRSPVTSKTVNGFIAFGPIPGCPGAASCRPPRSWRLGGRSGRVPAWPDPPPRSLEETRNCGHPAIPSGIALAQSGATECLGNREARQRSGTRTLTPRKIVGGARCERMCSIVILMENYIYIYRRIVRDGIAVI